MVLFKYMKDSGCVFNVCIYNVIFGMLGKKLRLEDMIKILCDMKVIGCFFNRIIWNIMFVMCGKIGMEKYVN